MIALFAADAAAWFENDVDSRSKRPDGVVQRNSAMVGQTVSVNNITGVRESTVTRDADYALQGGARAMPRVERTTPAWAAAWCDGGTLHRVSAAEGRGGTSRNRLATAVIPGFQKLSDENGSFREQHPEAPLGGFGRPRERQSGRARNERLFKDAVIQIKRDHILYIHVCRRQRAMKEVRSQKIRTLSRGD